MRFFDRLHPVPAFVYFLTVILTAMLTMNPVIIAICYTTGVIFCGMLIGWRKLLGSLAYSLPLTAMIALTNPLFVHKGKTILFFLNDNPVTLEAILYGTCAAFMLMAVFYWFRCYSEIMTSDKFIYLFGRVIPKLSLVLSMSLGFIPKMKQKFHEIDDAQKALGIYAGESYVDRVRSKMRVLSILLTNSLENGVDTADSMRARGYGLKGRTSYALYRFAASDRLFLILTILCGAGTLILIALGEADFAFYPTMTRLHLSVPAYLLYTLLTLLSGASAVMEVKENIQWHYLKSKI